MSDVTDRIRLYGTDEPIGDATTLYAGHLSLDIDTGMLRNICWQGIELIRGIDYPVRDCNWGTIPCFTKTETVKQGKYAWSYRRLFTSDDGQLDGELVAEGNAKGTLSVAVSFTANADYETARTGFTVLHPVEGLAGEKVEVRHGDGCAETLTLPREISPSQPIFDIAGLAYAIRDARTDIAFQGEIFEMEDQRNWTDASYKTYCRPLEWPSPFVISRGDTLTQRITVTFSGEPQIDDSESAGSNVVFSAPGLTEFMPEVTVTLEADFLPTTEILNLIRNTGTNRVFARLANGSDDTRIVDAVTDLGLPLDLEIVLSNELETARTQLAKIANTLRSAGLTPDHVLAVPVDYLKSHQPDGVWPEGVTPQDAVGLLREAFPESRIGGGALTNFTELNRCRPNPADCDFVSHSLTAIVHAADDKSVFQTLEAQPDIYTSTRAIAPDNAYRLGLVSIGMRSNPYGAAPLANPDQKRREMVQADPRQRGLFAAAWMVGAAAATQGAGIECMALAMPAGPLGLVYRREAWPQPLYDDDDSRIVYPAYHVFKALTEMVPGRRLHVVSPAGLFGTACQIGDDVVAVLSNGSPDHKEIGLPVRSNALVLNIESFDQATTNANWLSAASRIKTDELSLGPYAVAFVEYEAA